MPRIQAIVEIGPHQGSPYANWGVYEIGPDAFEDQQQFELDCAEMKEVLDDVDTGESPFGSFISQIQRYMLDAAAEIDAAIERDPKLQASRRRDFVFPYDQAHRELRDQELEVPEGSMDPQDLSVSVKVFTVEEDY